MIMSEGKKSILKRALLLILWFAYFYFMVMIARDLYQTHKDFHFHLASIIMVAIAMLIKPGFKLNFYSLIPASAVVFGGINYLYDARMEFGREYKLVLLSKYCLIACFIVWVMSILFSGGISKKTWKKSFGGIILLAFVIVSSIMKYRLSYYVIVPFLIILTVGNIGKKRISELMDIIAAALYLNFAVSMTVSLIVHPEKSSNGRYEGMFFFSVVVGLLSCMGIFAVIHFAKKEFAKWAEMEKRRKIIDIIAGVLLLTYPCIMLILSGNRASLLGIALIVLASFLTFLFRKGKKAKFISVAVILLILLSGILTLNWMAHNFDAQEFADRNRIDKQSTWYYLIVHMPSVRETNSTGVFEPRTVLASLDATSSDRLGIWVTGLKKVTLLGKNDMSIILPTGEDAGHVHSTYIYWLMYFGVIGGSLGIVWMLYLLADALCGIYYKKSEIIPSLFVILAFGMFFVEEQIFQELLPTLMILISYKFFYKCEENSEEDVVFLDEK